MNSKNTLNITLKSILTIALLGSLTTGCGKKKNNNAAEDIGKSQEVQGSTITETPIAELQSEETAIIGSDGSVTIVDSTGTVTEEHPAQVIQDSGNTETAPSDIEDNKDQEGSTDDASAGEPDEQLSDTDVNEEEGLITGGF